MTSLEQLSFELTDAHFGAVKDLLHGICGIDLRPGKEGLVKARLSKRLRALGLSSFDAYLDYVASDHTRQELAALVDAMTTNKTSFFREPAHFDFLAGLLDGPWRSRSRLRLWSAACSTGEEPFTLAMVLHEHLADLASRDVRILATDISARVLATAREGVYGEERLADVPAGLRARYLVRADDGEGRRWRVDGRLRSMIRFARLNLMGAWPMGGPLDAIFCRNVMIYFDKQTQGQLIRRFYDLLAPGGHLFIGHSESLTGITHAFRYVQPALYVR